MDVTRLTLSRRGVLAGAASCLVATGLAACARDEREGQPSDGGVQPKRYAADATSVRLLGRSYEDQGVRWLAQSGSGLEFEVTSPSVGFELAGDEHADNDREQCPRYAVLVDGAVVVDDMLTERSRTVEVPLHDPAASATVQLLLLSEALKGAVGVRAITLPAAASGAPAPTAEPALHLGFVGDSITCAYGVESAGVDDPFKTTQENFLKSYAYLASQELGASYDTACYSGYGIYSGWTGDGTRKDDWLVPALYELVVAGRDDAWDFAQHPSDVVVVNLGTNDFSYTQQDEARMAEFGQAYTAFLGRVRELNPASLIVCTMGTMGGEELYSYLEQAVRSHVDATGDARCLCYLSDPIDEADGMGTGGHPNAVTQRKSAEKLVSVIRAAL